MFSFESFLTEQKNLHMEHLEDEVLNNGVVGTRDAINFLRSLRDMLAGSSSSSVNVTVKWDGAPAVFAGINPENDQFFVGTKGVFAKAAKINYTHEDIDRNHSGGLASKLKVALDELSKAGISGILQGDMMYSAEDIKKETIDDESYITFQPNTIVYAVPVKSRLAAKILSSKMGIVWHTTYTGDTIEGLTASFGVSSGAFSKTRSVWQADASFKDTSGSATFTKSETAKVTAVLSAAGKMFHKLDSQVLGMITEDEKTQLMVKAYNNTKVRAGQEIKNTAAHTEGLIKYIEDKLQADVDKVKRVETKKNKQEVLDRYMNFFKTKRRQLDHIFQMQNILIEAKLMILRKLEQVKGLTKTFVKTSTGYKVTAPEGFVAIDTLKGGAVKLVDRLEFSMQNFNAAKNWDK